MLVIKKYAAIDIGSNAVRLLISNIIEIKDQPTRFKKSSLVRVPIRLGEDVFMNSSISPENIIRMQDTMKAFKLLMQSHRVERYKACATSAMREANNGEYIANLIKDTCDIDIDIIEGEEEAAIIATTDLSAYIQPSKTYLYVDVGGGSTEFSIIHNEKTVASKSARIGTIRILKDIVKHENWIELEQWIKSNTTEYDKIEVIGSGGNINKIFKISGKAMGKPLTYFYLSAYYHTLKSYTYEERITELDLNQDRADVIIPAMQIYLSAMKWSKAKHIYVPKIGLADGIVKSLYFETVSSKIL